jgi:LAO/AO transport system kinase
MEELSLNPDAFIRPSPSAGALGGVANATRESIILCEAAGFDIIIVETVGVGQSEISVHGMVDFFMLLMLAGAGDELQGIKRGIMEMADAILINKADGDNVKQAKLAKREYTNALHLFPPTSTGWIPKVEVCSSLKQSGIDKAFEIIQTHHRQMKIKGHFEEKRQMQAQEWMHENISSLLKADFFKNPAVRKKLPQLEQDVLNGQLNPYLAAQKLLELYTSKL